MILPDGSTYQLGMDYDGCCVLATKIPTLSTDGVDNNPEMYCSFAREEPYRLRCFACKRECKHSGEVTVYVRAI